MERFLGTYMVMENMVMENTSGKVSRNMYGNGNYFLKGFWEHVLEWKLLAERFLGTCLGMETTC